jgi:hypothetical protein
VGARLISREALERIIQRAAELQAHEREIGEGLTHDEVLALGKDVGIPGRYLQQALIEEEIRAGGEPEGGWLDWLAGPRALSAARVVPGDRTVAEGALAVWLEQDELLQVKRRYPDHTTWEPKGGPFASLQRAFGIGGKTFALARAAEIAGSVVPLEIGFCHVQLRADIANLRRQRLAGVGVLLGAGALASVLAPILGAVVPWAFVPLAAMALAAVAYGRGHRRDTERVHVALEQLLDRLEHGEARSAPRLGGPAASALGRIADELRTLVNPGPPPKNPGATPRNPGATHRG